MAVIDVFGALRMMPQMSHSHRTTYEAIFRHPAPHNLQWRDVRSMLGALAQTVEEPNGIVRATLHGRTMVLHSERHKDVSTEAQLKELRAFLKQPDQPGAPVQGRQGPNLLVVIDHRQARIYKAEVRGSTVVRIEPHDPDNAGRHLHVVEEGASGQRRPENKGYYEAIAASLAGAGQILIFGGGTGASSAMDQLVAQLNLHHKDLAARIAGSVVVDDHHHSEDGLLARAREFYTKLGTDLLDAQARPGSCPAE